VIVSNCSEIDGPALQGAIHPSRLQNCSSGSPTWQPPTEAVPLARPGPGRRSSSGRSPVRTQKRPSAVPPPVPPRGHTRPEVAGQVCAAREPRALHVIDGNAPEPTLGCGSRPTQLPPRPGGGVGGVSGHGKPSRGNETRSTRAEAPTTPTSYISCATAKRKRDGARGVRDPLRHVGPEAFRVGRSLSLAR
jgi:hypothetical protein